MWMVRKLVWPPELIDLVRQFAVDPWEQSLTDFKRLKLERPRGFVSVICYWEVYGRIAGETPSPRLDFEARHLIWVDSFQNEFLPFNRRREDVDPSEVFCLFVATAFPILKFQVCSFRSEIGNPCRECGSEWRETGYLKRRSLIPEWYGLPDLGKVLSEKKQRVYVEFCVECGRLEHRIVEDKPPFRTTDKRNRVHNRKWRRINARFSL